MSPALSMTVETKNEKETDIQKYQKGVKHLCQNGITKVPSKYILPLPERPNNETQNNVPTKLINLQLPIIDFAELQGPNRSQVLDSLTKACEVYGFFQLVNHGISSEVISKMIEVGTRFFELPHDERAKFMSNDMFATVRYGTSFNQNKDGVFCWRDFLKLSCNPLSDVLPHWPSSPTDFRKSAVTYAKETKYLYLMIMEAILESLGLNLKEDETIEREYCHEDDTRKDMEDGSQLMVVNCYPPCPEPDLTLGMPPHSDYGFLTLLLQDEVAGLQIHHQGQWVTLEPNPNSFVINVGDHLEIFSNGRYKSVLHRVLVNSKKDRISVASLHSLPFKSIVRPSPKLVNESNPRRYKDTDFSDFLEYVSSCEPKGKNFLESRKLTRQK